MKKQNIAKVPFETIQLACAGDNRALNDILNHYHGFICSLALEETAHTNGNVSMKSNEELVGMLQVQLIHAILENFDINYKSITI